MTGTVGGDHAYPSRVVRYGVALLALPALGAVQLVLDGSMDEGLALAVVPVAVLITAWVGGLWPSLAGTAGGILVTDLTVGLPGGLAGVTVAVFLFSVGLLIGLIVHRLRRQVMDERLTRADAERHLQHSDRLHQVAAALLPGRTPTDVIDLCLPELLHAVGGAAGALFVISEDGSEYQLAHALGYDGRAASAADRWPLSSGSPLAEAMLRRELVVFEASGGLPADHMTAEALFDVQPGDVLVPVVIAGRARGALLFRIPPPRTLHDDERELLIRAGRHIGQALDRAWSYESAERGRADAEALRVRADSELRERQKAEEAFRLSEARYRALAARTNRLYALSAGLSEAVSLKAVATVVVRHGKVVVGASAGSVSMLVEGGTQFETLYAEEPGSESATSGRRSPRGRGLSTTEAVETRRPVFIGSFEKWQEKYPESASMAADGGYVSSAVLPLMADGSVFGVLSFHFTLPVNFDDEYTALLTSVAQHCAQAVDRARLYETAERARAEAEAANRSKDDFLSTISHELRTPLNAMLGWAAMLRGGTLDAHRTQRAIEAIFNNATRQGRLIEELLDVSRIVAGRASFDRQDVDLAENVRGAVEAMMPLAASKGVELRLEVPAGVNVTADPRRLEQVFLNLLSNAVKFTPQGGRISVEVKTLEGHAEVRVSDTGAGIDPAFLPHVFDRFRQADSAPTRAAGGLGLGLFISRQLAEAQGGTIRAESAGIGCGAAFTVTLPAAMGTSTSRRITPSVGQPGTAEQPDPLPSLNGISVLLVDDEPDAREVMASALESCGATVISAASAREALDTLAHTEIDLLLSDIAMPGQDGYELIRDIRAMPSTRLATIPAAAVTAHARDDERERALAAGFHLHLTKPVHPAALASAVASLAATRHSVGGSTRVESR